MYRACCSGVSAPARLIGRMLLYQLYGCLVACRRSLDVLKQRPFSVDGYVFSQPTVHALITAHALVILLSNRDRCMQWSSGVRKTLITEACH